MTGKGDSRTVSWGSIPHWYWRRDEAGGRFHHEPNWEGYGRLRVSEHTG